VLFDVEKRNRITTMNGNVMRSLKKIYGIGGVKHKFLNKWGRGEVRE